MAIRDDINPDLEDAANDVGLVTLDGETEVRFTIQGLEGRNPFQISRDTAPPTSTQLAQGGTKYDDFELPFRPVVQQDWSGGRASEDFEVDTSRYLDSGGINTELSGRIFLQGLPSWPTGYRDNVVSAMPGDVTWHALNSTDALYRGTASLTLPTSTTLSVLLWLRKVGNPGNLTISLYNRVAGNPDTIVAGGTYTSADWPFQQGLSGIVAVSFGAVAGTINYIVLKDAAGTATDYWEVACDEAVTGVTSADGTTWANDAGSPYHLLWDTAQGDSTFKMFQYKGAMYFVSVPVDGSNSFLYMAGDRGAADSNAGNKTRVIDATKAWDTDEWAGSYVRIVAGPGSEEVRPYRKIDSNTSTQLVCSEGWEITHTTETEYVILSPTIQELADLGGRVTDVALAGRYVYFARGSNASLYKWFEINLAGVWTQVADNETGVIGEFLLAQKGADGYEYLWVADNADDALDVSLQRYRVPQGRGILLHVIDTVAPTSRYWGDKVGSATVTLEPPDILKMASMGSYNLGDALLSTDLDVPVDLSTGTHTAAMMRAVGNTPVVDFYLSDTPHGDQKQPAASVLHAHRPYRLPSSVLLRRSLVPASEVVHYDGTDYFNISGLKNLDETYQFKHTWAATTDKLYVAFSERVNAVGFVLDTDFNTIATVMTAKYWDGNGWIAVVGMADGTIAPAGTSFGQTGAVTFTHEEKWNKGGGEAASLSEDLYWLEFSWSVTQDSTVLSLILGENTDSDDRIDEVVSATALFDGQNSSTLWTANGGTLRLDDFNAGDRVYICSEDPFDEIRIDVAEVNGEASDVSIYVPVDGVWTAAVTEGDTTDTGAALAQDGLITFSLPDNVQQLTINGVTGYWVYLVWSADLDAGTALYEISVRDRRRFHYTELDVTTEGEDATIGQIATFAVGDFLMVCAPDRFDALDMNLPTPGAGAILNNNNGTAALDFFDGNDWTAGTITSDGTDLGPPLAQPGVIQFSTGAVLMQRVTVAGVFGYWVRVGWDFLLDPVLIHGVGVQRNQKASQSFIVSPAGDWTSGTLSADLDDNAVVNGVDCRNIRNVKLIISQNKPTTLELRGGYVLCRRGGFSAAGFGVRGERIAGLELFGEDFSNPWSLTEKTLYETQTENDNAIAQFPLEEIASLSSPISGRYHTTNDVYLWFNIGNFVHRYFNRTLEHVGFTRDAGMPADRLGEVSLLYSLPGRVLIGVDATTGFTASLMELTRTDGFGTLLVSYGSALHEVFRAPVGMGIHNAHVQTIPGTDSVDRLWLSVGPFLVYLPLPNSSLNPLQDAAYTYQPDGYLMTGWISAGFLDVEKLFVRLKVASENLAAGRTVTVYYQTDSGDHVTGWTQAVDVLDTSPFDTTKLATNFVNAKRLRFMLVLNTNDSSETPVVRATILSTILRLPSSNSYGFQIVLGDAEEDRQGGEDIGRTGLTEAQQLDTWSDTPVPLRLYSLHGLFDDKIVFIEPPGARPVGPRVPGGRYMYAIRLTEVEP